MQRTLAVPRPDMSPLVKAMVGCGGAAALAMALEAQAVGLALEETLPRGSFAEAAMVVSMPHVPRSPNHPQSHNVLGF